MKQLRNTVMDHCLKGLEKYVVRVSWPDKVDATTEDLSRLLTDPGRARVSAAVANLVDNDEIEFLDYNKGLVGLLNERAGEFEGSLVSLRAIALGGVLISSFYISLSPGTPTAVTTNAKS